MSGKQHVVELTHAVVGHEAVRRLVFRDPRWKDLIRFGPAHVWVPRGDGKFTAVPDHAVVGQYAEECMLEPADALSILDDIGLADGQRVADLFFGLSLSAEIGTAPSSGSSKSSSEPAGDTATSRT